jgi:hypothetical protein
MPSAKRHCMPSLPRLKSSNSRIISREFHVRSGRTQPSTPLLPECSCQVVPTRASVDVSK